MKKMVYPLTLFWAISAICLVPRIDSFNYDFIRSKGISERDILFRTLGEVKDLISDFSYLKADEYYHGGVKHKHLEPHVCLLRDKQSQISGGGEKDRRRHQPRHKHQARAEKFSRLNLLPRIGREISVHEIRHLHGQEEKEVAPWFYYAAKLNPHNIDAYVIGAYWVGSRLGKVDEALKFLNEGMRYNPDAWQIYSEAGNLYFDQKQDYLQAIKFYSKAEFLMTDKNADRRSSFRVDKFNKSHVFTFLGASYEKIGKIDRAIEYYQKDIELFPTHEGLRERIKELEMKGKFR